MKSDENPAGWKVVGAPKAKKARGTQGNMFATRSITKPLTDAIKEEAESPTALADTPIGCTCSAPVNIRVDYNKVNGTITITTLEDTDTEQYMRNAEKMTEAISLAVDTDGSNYMLFRRVPTDVNLMVLAIFHDLC